MSEFAQQQVPLKQLNIYLTDGCSLSCRHCWQRANFSRNHHEKRQLSVVFFMQAVREALTLGLQTVLLTGEEPLQHPHFDTLFDWLEKLPVQLIIETCGSGLTPKRVERLAKSEKVSLTIGIDGADAETHDAIHHSPGSFNAAAEAVCLLAEAGLPPQVVFSLARQNVHQISASVQLAEKLGAVSVRFSIPQQNCGQRGSHFPPAELESRTDELLTVPELIAIGRKIDRELASSTRLRLAFDQPPAFRGLQPNGYIDGQGRCGILNTLGVLPNGRYALCGAGQSADELILGKVGADPLDRIWQTHPVLKTLRSGMPDRLEGICERCIMKTACLGNCVAENYFRSGSFWGPYWFCDSAERAGLFPAGRLIENNW